MFNQALTQIKEVYNVIQEDAQSVVFESGDKLFSVCENYPGLTIYQCYKDNQRGIVFLPGFKQGKTFRAVKSFVSSRVEAG